VSSLSTNLPANVAYIVTISKESFKAWPAAEFFAGWNFGAETPDVLRLRRSSGIEAPRGGVWGGVSPLQWKCESNVFVSISDTCPLAVASGAHDSRHAPPWQGDNFLTSTDHAVLLHQSKRQLINAFVMPNSHHLTRLHLTVELSRVG